MPKISLSGREPEKISLSGNQKISLGGLRQEEADQKTQGFFDKMNRLIHKNPEAADKMTVSQFLKGISSVASKEEAKAVEKAMESSGAAQETLKHIGQSIYGFPLSGLAGIANMRIADFKKGGVYGVPKNIAKTIGLPLTISHDIMFGDLDVLDAGERAYTKTSETLMPKPKSEKGQELMGTVGYPLQKLSEYSDKAGKFAAKETGISALEPIVKTAGEMLPVILGAKATKSAVGKVKSKIIKPKKKTVDIEVATAAGPEPKVFSVKPGAVKETVKAIKAADPKAKITVQKTKPDTVLQKIDGMMGTKPKKGVKDVLKGAGSKFFDRFGPIKKYSKSAYEKASVHSSYKDVAWRKFSELVDGLKVVKKDEALFTQYILASRARTRARRGLDNPNGVTLSDSRLALREIETRWAKSGRQVQDLRQTRKNFNDWTRKYILDEGVASGVISQKAYRKILKENDFYAAFDVLELMPEGKLKTVVGGEYFSVTGQKVIRKMTGTKKKIDNPIETTAKKFLQAQALYSRNKVARALLDDPVIKGQFTTVVRSAKEAKKAQNKKQLYKYIEVISVAGAKPKRLKIRMDKATDTINSIKETIPKAQIRELAVKKEVSATPKKVHVEGNPLPKDFDTIAMFKDGVVEKYVVPKELAASMKQLTPYQAPRVIQMVNGIFRKSATTVYLPFTISNATRDAFMAYTTAPVHANPIRFGGSWAKGFWEGTKHEFLGKSDLAKAYIEEGGGFGYVGNLRQHRFARDQLFKKGMVKKSGDIITSPIKLIEKISSSIELAPRLATHKAALKKGYSPKQAALMARRSTIDFNRGGSWTKVVNQFVPFLNARVQARVTLADALGVPEYFNKAVYKKPLPKGTTKKQGQTLAKIGTSVVVPGAIAYAWNRLRFSEYYDDIPEEIRKNYFVIITGVDFDKYDNEVPQYVVIPKGDVGQIAWNPIEYGLDEMMEKDREGTKKFLFNYVSDISPVDFIRDGELSASKTIGGLTPPVIKGAIENVTNLNFWSGREVVPHYMGKTLPPELQYHELTPELYKKLGKLTGTSPLKLQNFAANLLAGYGREGLDPSAMMRGLTGRLIKTKGGAKKQKVWTVIKDIEQGYMYTRAYANEMVNDGDRAGANELMNEWNTGLRDRIEKIKDFGWKDKGGIRQSYMFTPRKRRGVLIRRGGNRDPLEKRLSRRKY